VAKRSPSLHGEGKLPRVEQALHQPIVPIALYHLVKCVDRNGDMAWMGRNDDSDISIGPNIEAFI